jgi:hypothetical protein
MDEDKVERLFVQTGSGALCGLRAEMICLIHPVPTSYSFFFVSQQSNQPAVLQGPLTKPKRQHDYVDRLQHSDRLRAQVVVAPVKNR